MTTAEATALFRLERDRPARLARVEAERKQIHAVCAKLDADRTGLRPFVATAKSAPPRRPVEPRAPRPAPRCRLGCGAIVTGEGNACHSCAAAARGQTTHCKRGHRRTPENTYVKPDGARSCRACRNEESARRRLELKARQRGAGT